MNKLFGIAALGAVLAVPAFSYAAPYAYVNASGEVNMVEAASAQEALTTAPNIHMRSGVMLLQSENDDILNDSI